MCLNDNDTVLKFNKIFQGFLFDIPETFHLSRETLSAKVQLSDWFGPYSHMRLLMHSFRPEYFRLWILTTRRIYPVKKRECDLTPHDVQKPNIKNFTFH